MLLRHLIVLMIVVRSNQAAKQDQKDHYACRMYPIEPGRLVIEPSMLQDEQLSNTFPLHNDKQQRNHRFR